MYTFILTGNQIYLYTNHKLAIYYNIRFKRLSIFTYIFYYVLNVCFHILAIKIVKITGPPGYKLYYMSAFVWHYNI